MDIVSRTTWSARYPRGFGPAPLPAAEVWLHHSVTAAPAADPAAEQRAMRQLEDIGQQRFGGGISYTFAVMPSGRVYEGHGVDREGAHTAGRNSIARAIVLVGDYSTRPPTDAQVRAVAELLRHGQATGWWKAARLNGGHRQAPGASTACPGDAAMAAVPHINLLAAGKGKGKNNVQTFQNLILAREAEGKPGSSWPAVYVGDGIVRRHVASERDLENLQARIQQAGGDAAIHEGWAPGSLAGVLGVLVKEPTD